MSEIIRAMDPERIKRIMDEASKYASEFEKLLEKIDYASPETKKLWHEIYNAANEERAHAIMLFADVCTHILGSDAGHTLYGKLAATYLERMSKANDQLLKLAELVEASSAVENDIDAEALYEEIDK